MEISVKEHQQLIEAFKKHDGHVADSLVRHTAIIGAEVLIDSMVAEFGAEKDVASVIRRHNNA
jgi:hypothetical protein